MYTENGYYQCWFHKFLDNEDSEQGNKAEIIIGKQRNGPIGTVNLTFLKEYTRFENFSNDGFYDSFE